MQLQKQPVRSAERMVACSEGGLQQLTDWLAVGLSLSLIMTQFQNCLFFSFVFSFFFLNFKFNLNGSSNI